MHISQFAEIVGYRRMVHDFESLTEKEDENFVCYLDMNAKTGGGIPVRHVIVDRDGNLITPDKLKND